MDYSKLKRAQLQALCRERNIKGLTQKNDALIKLLLESDASQAPASSSARDYRPPSPAKVTSSKVAATVDAPATQSVEPTQPDTSSSEVAQLQREVDRLKPELYHALGQIVALQTQLKEVITPAKCAEIVSTAVSEAKAELRTEFDSQLATLRQEITAMYSVQAVAMEEEAVVVVNRQDQAEEIETSAIILTPASEAEDVSDSLSSASTVADSLIPAPAPAPAESIPLPPSPAMASIERFPDESTETHSPRQSTPATRKPSSPRTMSFFSTAASPLAPRAATPQQKPTVNRKKSLLGNPFSKTPQSAQKSLPVAPQVAIAVTPAGPKTMYGGERDENSSASHFGDVEAKTGASWNRWQSWKV